MYSEENGLHHMLRVQCKTGIEHRESYYSVHVLFFTEAPRWLCNGLSTGTSMHPKIRANSQ